LTAFALGLDAAFGLGVVFGFFAALASAAASRSRTKMTSGTLIGVSGGGCELTLCDAASKGYFEDEETRQLFEAF